MITPQTKQKIEDLIRQLTTLKKQKRRRNQEADKVAQRRKKIREQLKTLHSEILHHENARNDLNERVKELKGQREGKQRKITQKIEESRTLTEKRNTLLTLKPHRQLLQLQRDIDKLDWKIQTNPLSLKEEREFVAQIKKLEIQRNIHQKLESLNQQCKQLKVEIETLKMQRNLFHEKLLENAQNSQSIHEKMIAALEKTKKLRNETANLHTHFLQVNQKIKLIQNDIWEISNQLKKLDEAIKRDEAIEKKKSEQALLAKFEKQMKKKLECGEKLTWEEFKLLSKMEDKNTRLK